jgi:NADH:ubiquinone oxidoreductase subunit 6 (subunit J)
MDSLHAIGFYVSAALSVAGGLSVAFLPDRTRRALALGASGIGVAGIYVSLSAAFAGVTAVVCFVGCAALLAGPGYRIVELQASGRWRQIGAVAAAGLFAVLAYSAFHGRFASASFLGGGVGADSIGRLLFTHDALAAEAVGALILVALVGATAAWRGKERKL